jgi:endoglucanase
VQSEPFAIATDVYAQLKFDALNFFYQQRSGEPIEMPFAGGDEWTRPAGHPSDTATCYGPVDMRGNDWGGCPYTLDVTGGWYDAGDHGKYVVNSGVTVWTLLNYYERSTTHPAAAATVADGAAAIPENANGQPDLLDEARNNLEFMLAMQVPAGTTLTLPLGDQYGNQDALVFSTVDASGMAHHKIHDEYWTGIPQAPHLDPAERYLSYPSTGATLDLAAIAAQCARLWDGIDQPFAERCLTAAERAYAAAQRVPDALAYNVVDGGGLYGDASLDDEFYWAATELFITTGDSRYADDMRASAHFLAAPRQVGYTATAVLGNLSLLQAADRLTAAERSALADNLLASADELLALTAGEGYHIPFGGPYRWGSNSTLANIALVLAQAFDVSGEERYRQGVVDAMDYLLGRNPNNKSYVSGHGENPMMNPHHRFWAHQADPAYPGPPPGALAGGPNFSDPAQDEIAAQIRPDCAPQTCYQDHVFAYSLNEVAINWNAPLFWIAAFLDERS